MYHFICSKPLDNEGSNLSLQAHVVNGKMIVKVQYQNRKKYIKLQASDFEEFISQVKEKFSIPVNNITVEDDSGTEVDKTVFAELSTVEGICFIKDDQDYDSGPSQLSPTPTPRSSFSGSSLSVSISSSDGETSRPPKRIRSDEEACQSRSARDLIQQILQTKPGGTTVLEEYEETGTLCDSRRRQMINILAAHMVETEGRIPQRVTKEKYALGIVTLFPALKDPLSKKGYIPQDFILLFGPETAAKLLEKWHTCYKRKVIREAESLTTTPVLQSLLKSARNQCNDDKKKTQKISPAQAMDHLVVFHKSCRSLEHLENQEGHRQPYLLASGTHKQAISTYYVVMDKKLIPCLGTTSLAAFDELFKVHFVFSVSYDNALSNMYTFLQTTVYSIDVETTKESPKVKELRAKFMNRS
ncbi:uncharacterized protein LOC116045134 [Sander lucioperca]|uniref:uncharacterized protein LOC116045134 n=1 Tax=Sander lucioperca TaxID=283035 RepID=UPI00125D569B|nr:uncharacterized protein LOC116045134 [Sander lucioperca]